MAKPPVVFIGRDYILDSILDEIAAELARRGCEVIRGWGAKPPAHTDYPPADWPQYFRRAEVILVSTRTRCPRALLQAAPRLRALVFPTIGTESVDLRDAAELGLLIAHGATPENFVGMGEATVMLIAALLLDLHEKERLTRLSLPRPKPRDIRARLVQGKTIGFVGLGRIARAAVARLQGWQARILATDPYLQAGTLPAGVELVDLATLLAQSDVVSIHVALTNETRHMIGANELRRMKPTAFLINTARAGAVDEEALIDALKAGRIAGAALDVFTHEPLPPDSPFRTLDNVILTSHMVGHTQEAYQSLAPAAVENVMRVLRGEPPLYVRNPEVLPAWRQRLARLAEA